MERLQEIFQALDESAGGKLCKGMEGLIEEGKEMLEEEGEDAVLDAGLITAAQRVEHYEIAAYGSLRTFAEILGDEKAVKLLDLTLEEEKETDEKLTEIAKALNLAADSAEGDESDDEEGASEGKKSGSSSRRTLSKSAIKTKSR